jgi:hypothetical protein
MLLLEGIWHQAHQALRYGDRSRPPRCASGLPPRVPRITAFACAALVLACPRLAPNPCTLCGSDCTLPPRAQPFFLFCGPNVLQGREHALRLAECIAKVKDERKLEIIFKASYDKANRTSLGSFRGPGMEEVSLSLPPSLYTHTRMHAYTHTCMHACMHTRT